MIKRAISIATILLVILGVGIVLTKASPRVSRDEAAHQRVDVVGNYVNSMVVEDRRLDLVREASQRVQFVLQNVRVLNARVLGDVRRELPNRLVGNELSSLRGVLVGNLPALLDANHRGNNLDLNNRHNLVEGMEHLNKSRYLAVENLRACATRQLDNVLTGLRPVDLRKFPVFGTVDMQKELTVDRTLAVQALSSFELPSLKTLRHKEVADAHRLVQKNTVNVLVELGEQDLAVA